MPTIKTAVLIYNPNSGQGECALPDGRTVKKDENWVSDGTEKTSCQAPVVLGGTEILLREPTKTESDIASRFAKEEGLLLSLCAEKQEEGFVIELSDKLGNAEESLCFPTEQEADAFVDYAMHCLDDSVQ